MAILRILRSFFRRRVRGLLLSSESYRRYDFILREVNSSPEQVKRQQQTWWGQESVWYPGGTPPRLHNQITPLIDGETFFPALQQALSQAKAYVFICGWSLTPYIPLRRDDPEQLVSSRLLVLLNEVAQRVPVRILVWSGAPFLFQPGTNQTSQLIKLLETEGRGDLKCHLDRSAPLTHCHHQKAIVIDGQIAFVGGMDLTTFLGDRYDSPKHVLRAGLNWHDVQLKIEGEAVADVEDNFRQRWQAALKQAGSKAAAEVGIGVGVEEKLESQLPARREPYYEEDWSTPVQIVRTIPRGVYRFAPRGEFGIYHAYTNLIARAEHFIYLENQYLWSPHIMEALSSAINKPRANPLRIVIVLPAKAEDGKWDNDKHVQQLRKLDQGRKLISIYSLYTSGANLGVHPFTYRGIYVHAKVAIIDDEWFMVGSANLNNRGLVTDSELSAVVHDREQAFKLRSALWSEHLGLPMEQIAQLDPLRLIEQEWPRRAALNVELLKKKERPLACAVYPYQIGKMPGEWFLEEAEALTFEH